MYLLIDTVSHPANYILFDLQKNIVSKDLLEIKGSESELFLDSILSFLSKNNIQFQNLTGVVVVNGPWSFTAMRIITLTINTLVFVHPILLYSVDYFTFGSLWWWEYPILMRANRGEYLIQKNKDSSPELIEIPNILPRTYYWVGDINDFKCTNDIISIQSTLDYSVFCKNFPMDSPVQKIEPLYIKKPNIT